MDVIDVRNNMVRPIPCPRSLPPALAPIRRCVPPLGGLDLSFLKLFVLIQFCRYVLVSALVDAVLA